MAYITIKTKTDEGLITLQERVVPSDMVSEFFCAHLVERLRWAIEDAHVTPSLAELDGENATDRPGRTSRPRDMPFGACPRALTARSAEKRFRLSRAIRFSPCTAIGSFLVAGSAPLAADHASRLISYTSGAHPPISAKEPVQSRADPHQFTRRRTNRYKIFTRDEASDATVGLEPDRKGDRRCLRSS